MKTFELEFKVVNFSTGKVLDKRAWYADLQNAMNMAIHLDSMEDVVGGVDVVDACTGEVYATVDNTGITYHDSSLKYELASREWYFAE